MLTRCFHIYLRKTYLLWQFGAVYRMRNQMLSVPGKEFRRWRQSSAGGLAAVRLFLGHLEFGLHARWHGEQPILSLIERLHVILLFISGLRKTDRRSFERSLFSMAKTIMINWSKSLAYLVRIPEVFEKTLLRCPSWLDSRVAQELMGCSPIWTSTIRNWIHTSTTFWAGSVVFTVTYPQRADQFRRVIWKSPFPQSRLNLSRCPCLGFLMTSKGVRVVCHGTDCF